MTYIPDFDVEAVLSTLESVSKTQPEDSKERGAIQLAAISLLYVRHAGKLDDFRRYYQEFFDPSFQIKVSHEFATREEADAWLASGTGIHGERVKIAGKGFQVVRLPGRGMRFLSAPLPSELASSEPD
ncbi:hypothetical protein HPC49_21175 [Pyxidicoccus fallax]|uniref:Uncharacterized protein n=1 Tax=Pyxidicoccus fallax TaxID=394095 RepID=A0A848LAX1_9BACT|nr:hypothetical protein [Pyxidicoccus fallax]NMO15392.1 hypothetical protein [Pyxidicoccus fallax]NPC80726.1 hypothetical protein [Pyxidicoccus fallax]